MRFTSAALGLAATLGGQLAHAQAGNSTFHNPILPGWHSDPSCVRVEDTYFCGTSTFIAFPGLPLYASKDLVNWRLASHTWNRESQLPGLSWNTTGQQHGMFASTVRYHNGELYVICEYLGIAGAGGNIGVIFKTTDPFDDDAWSDPVTFLTDRIDPDLFWDDDGTVYVATQGILLQTIDMETGELSQPPVEIWPGTGGVWPEGPHIYKRDGYYYVLIAEGGTERDHAITIARSQDIWGPYESYEGNPILTNRGTDEYFQTVGHGDLFTDLEGKWWGVALATRVGPQFTHFPMGRETVLYSARWDEGEWPVLDPVRGNMTGWPLPPETRDVPGDGQFVADPDAYRFDAESPVPKHFVYWRVPRPGTFSMTDSGLEIVPSRSNLTGIASSLDPVMRGQHGLSFVGRRQTFTLFKFSVDLIFAPTEVGQEAGITVFLTQYAHIDIGVVLLESGLSLRFRTEGNGPAPPENVIPVPGNWTEKPIRLHIEADDPTSYRLSASSGCGKPIEVGTASSRRVSGATGSFVGSLVGAYATCNGAGQGTECPEGGVATFQRWVYTPVAQFVDEGVSIPA
ncbi:glycoside hydrolase family 43 protein [Stachybotrys elegans]|uniref:Glycoside hydrolase family 43 protein n=1 Tax=Stachybotrys elegans TaxID=80388 RepID=A0A8K0SJR7_9HYPO|nr:glycoside hydrolase family 43 protein [Stachybotrys elegans]